MTSDAYSWQIPNSQVSPASPSSKWFRAAVALDQSMSETPDRKTPRSTKPLETTANNHVKLTVIEYVLSRLRGLGVTDVFGVPGDYAFPIDDAICANRSLRWVGCCNELNAAYAADGYARVKGMAVLSCTFGPGELSAMAGIAGSYAEHLPVFHLVGMPDTSFQDAHAIIHHTLGNGEYDLFYKMAEPVVCARAIMTPENCVAETERLIAAALYHCRPVYMVFPRDTAEMPIIGNGVPLPSPKSDSVELEAAVEAIAKMVSNARTACILPGIMLARLGLRNEAEAVVNVSGLPFATMFMDKGVLDETHGRYIGMYDGQLMDEEVRAFVESCDCVLSLGPLMTDINTGSFTAKIDRSKSISIMHHHVRVGSATYPNVEMKDVLTALAKRLAKRSDVKGPKAKPLGEPKGSANDKITQEYLYPRLERFLKPDDIVVTETGTASLGVAFAALPKGSTVCNQALWGSIGWATPAAFGAALAAPSRRVVLVTGEGAHQLTAQEVSQFHRFGLKPIIFVLNNSGYLIERLLCRDGDMYYNDLAKWNYALLPGALGCEGWFTARVTTCGELDQAMKHAENNATGAYIEIIADKYMMPPLGKKLQEAASAYYNRTKAL